MIVISDLYGTLVQFRADRIRLIQKDDYATFIAGMNKDRPIPAIRTILQTLYQRGHQIHLFTGAAEPAREAIETWLWDFNVPFAKLLMRKEGDTRADIFLKWDWIKTYNKGQVFLTLEDHTPTVQLYRRLGFLCLQPAQNATVDTQRRSMRTAIRAYKVTKALNV